FTVTTAANTFRNNTNSINSDYKAKQQQLQHIQSAVTFHHNQIHQPLDNTSAFNTQLNNATLAAVPSTSSATLAVKEILNRRRKKNEFVSRNEHIFTTTISPPSLAANPTTSSTTTVWLSRTVYAAVSTSTSSTTLLFQDFTTESSSSAESSTAFNDTLAGYENSEIPEIPSVVYAQLPLFFCIHHKLMGVIGNVMFWLICTPTVLVELNTKPETWILGHEMCKAVPFVELTVAHASVLTILAISFERYYAICEPLKAGYVCTKTRAILICSLAWGIAALFTSLECRHSVYSVIVSILSLSRASKRQSAFNLDFLSLQQAGHLIVKIV
ncbi:hypothetical protein DOY81_011020, partial [Sarcophaga bullata]